MQSSQESKLIRLVLCLLFYVYVKEMGFGDRLCQVKRLIAGAFMVNGITNIMSYAGTSFWNLSRKHKSEQSVAAPLLYYTFQQPQDLRRKYGAQWAVVTGASSGIGAAFTERLAQQVILATIDSSTVPYAVCPTGNQRGGCCTGR